MKLFLIRAIGAGLLLLLLNSCFSQNLIQNSSFERILNQIPKSVLNEKKYLEVDTLLYKNKKKGVEILGVSSLFWNDTESNNYGGCTFYSNTGNARTGNIFSIITPFLGSVSGVYGVKNLKGKLSKSLKKDSLYKLSFWIKPFRGNFYMDTLYVHFDENSLPYTGEKLMRAKERKLIRENKDIIIDKLYSPIIFNKDCFVEVPRLDVYSLVETLYKAKGNEKYIYIGNLGYNVPSKYKKRNFTSFGKKSKSRNYPFCRYSIDDIKLVQVNTYRKEKDENRMDTNNIPHESNLISCESNSKNLNTQRILVPASNFELNNSKLNKFDEVKFLSSIQHINFNNIDSILIKGYTDSIGNKDYNKKLSLDRAKTIKNLLESKIDCNSLIIEKGLGSAFPVESNETSKGRAKNRRVEIEIFYGCQMQKK